MKLIHLLKELDDVRLDAELGDYQLVGNWGDKEKSHGFRHAADRKMLQNPTAIRLTHQKFGRTDHNLNFYFVNLPGAAKHAEHGFMEPEQIAQSMPKAWPEIAARAQEADHENAINVIFVGNTGFQRMNMTPWIMAHRIGHALQSSERGNLGYGGGYTGPWSEYEQDASDFFAQILNGVYDMNIRPREVFMGRGNDKLIAKFFEAIGGMRSARKGQLGGRPYEFLYEMFAQHVLTGALKFRELPQSFGVRGGPFYRIKDEESQDAADMWNRSLNSDVGDHLSSRIDNTLYNAEGKFLVM